MTKINLKDLNTHFGIFSDFMLEEMPNFISIFSAVSLFAFVLAKHRWLLIMIMCCLFALYILRKSYLFLVTSGMEEYRSAVTKEPLDSIEFYWLFFIAVTVIISCVCIYFLVNSISPAAYL